jgi:iron complex outermembrane receptor protein
MSALFLESATVTAVAARRPGRRDNVGPAHGNGSATAGYRVQDTTAAGPIWGDLPIQDAPYSIGVEPSDLIENPNATTSEDIYPQSTISSSASNPKASSDANPAFRAASRSGWLPKTCPFC